MSPGAAAALRRTQGRRWLLVLAGYALPLAACSLVAARGPAGYWASNALLGALGVHAIAASDLPAAHFGLTLRGARRALASAALSTALLLAGGALLLRLSGAPAGPGFGLDPGMAAYLLLSVPLQELVFRGVFPGAVRFLLGADDPRAGAAAVLVSTLAFCAVHLPWGPGAALLVAVPGLVWGIQAERDRSLLGVVLSHLAVGWTFLGALPLWSGIAG